MRYVVPGLLGVCLCTAVTLFGAVELQLGVFVYCIAALLALIWAAKLFFAKTALWKPSPMHWPVLAFVAYTFIHYFLSPYEYLSRLELFQVSLYGLIYFFAANNINRGRERTILISILLVFGTLEAMYGIWQGYTKQEMVLNAYRPPSYLTRGSGTFICPNHLAGLLEMILGFALARLALHRLPDSDSIEAQVISKVMLAYAVFTMLIGILFTFSRSGWIATAVGMLVFLIWGGLRTKGVLARIGVGVAGLCISAFLLFNIPSVKYHLTLTTLKQEPGIALKDAGLNGRTLLWGATWNMIKDHPVFGTGAGTWEWVHQKYRHPLMQFAADYAHNDILQTTSDYGIIGSLIVLVAIAGFCWHTWRMTVYGVTSEQRCFAVGAVLAVTILVVHSWFDFNLHILANGLLFSTILGLVAGMEIPDGPYVARVMKPASRYALGAVLVAVVAAGMFFVVPAALACRYTELGNAKKYYLQWNEAIDYFEKAIRYDPKYIVPRTKLGDIYKIQADFRVGEDKGAERLELAREAIKHYWAALALNPVRADIHIKLARAYEAIRQFDEARKSFDRALEVDPNNAIVHMELGMYLRRRGDEPSALRALETSTRLQPNALANSFISELRNPTRAD